MDVILVPALQILFILLNLYMKVVIVAVIVSWLRAFNVINPSNRIVYLICETLDRLTDPLFNLFRRIIPPFGSVDISPIFALLAIQFCQSVILRIFMRLQ